jgi:glutamate 5-kinase
MSRADFIHAKRIVVKIGSSLLTAGGQGLNQTAIAAWVKQIALLTHQYHKEIIVVSSGAVAAGIVRLKFKQRPKKLHQLQAAAAVGQMSLVRIFEKTFQYYNLETAQILLTHDDSSNRQRYLNARNTLLTLLNLSVIPIVNENDTVATDEIRLGDNDTLSALVANLVKADLLIILTDQQGLFNADPSINLEATLIEQINVNEPLLDKVAGKSRSGLGRGGMFTKVKAARLASRSGTATVIVSGTIEAVITNVLKGVNLGTYLIPTLPPLTAKKQWFVAQLQLKGYVILDEGAVKVLQTQGKSLLAIGVISASGAFKRGDLVTCQDRQGKEIARGLINYNMNETLKIKGHHSKEFERVLGYINYNELIHINNMVVY